MHRALYTALVVGLLVSAGCMGPEEDPATPDEDTNTTTVEGAQNEVAVEGGARPEGAADNAPVENATNVPNETANETDENGTVSGNETHIAPLSVPDESEAHPSVDRTFDRRRAQLSD